MRLALRVGTWMCVAAALTGGIALAGDKAPSTRPAPATYSLWDGKETQAEYAKRAGIKDVEIALDLGKGVKMKLILIPAGEFTMGSKADVPRVTAAEVPAHEVAITRPFYMSVTEVTQGQYEAVTGSNPSRFKRADKPVEDLTWPEAEAFCKAASARVARPVALPTEAQWEYACRAGTDTLFYWGDDEKPLFDYTWRGSHNAGPGPVAQKKPNAWGLYDMAGNVNEWCRDWFDPTYYAHSPAADPPGPEAGKRRVLRGGAAGNILWCRSGHREKADPAYRFGMSPSPMIVGFRVVVAIDDAVQPAPAAAATGVSEKK